MAVKKKKIVTYNGKPIVRCGNRIYYGNFEDKLILVLDIVETKKVFRKATRDNLYKALDIGEWWLKDALKQLG